MKEEHEFLSPSYAPRFNCKIGLCRHVCCNGWPVTFSLNDYYLLMGRDCGEELRQMLDRGVKISLSPTPEAYAEILPRYDGSCPMRLRDGRCAIQGELGEEALTQVCRFYPRGIRTTPDYEYSFANSCEGVIELLISDDEPVRFEKRRITTDLPPTAERSFAFPTMGKETEIRLWLINFVGDRSKPLYKRLMTLGLALKDLEAALAVNDASTLKRLIDTKDYKTENVATTEDVFKYGLDTMQSMLKLLDERSDSLREYGEEALNYFSKDNSAYERYLNAKEHFEEAFPKWEIWFEKILINHMFFEQFPFQDRRDGPWEELVAICAVYALLRFLSLGRMAHRESVDDFVDMVSATFRLINHTDFDYYCSRLLKKLGCTVPEKVFALISL